MRLFEHRNDLIHHYLKSNMIGAELGVFVGEFSEVILSTKPSIVYLVDLFSGISGSGDKDGNNMVFVDMNLSYNRLLELHKNNKCVRVVKSSTHDFLSSLADNSLDFVYIDADHSYEGVCSDINLSFFKVKSGGYIMGHDYVTPRFHGLVQAVQEFCSTSNLCIDGLSKCGCPSYCIPVTK